MCGVVVAEETLSWLAVWAWAVSTASGAVVSITNHSTQAAGSGSVSADGWATIEPVSRWRTLRLATVTRGSV